MIHNLIFDQKIFGLKKSFILKVMHFLNFRDFYGIFLNLFEFCMIYFDFVYI